MKPKYELFNKKTTAIIYGEKQNVIQRMLEFDFLSQREKPSVEAVINPMSVAREYMKVFFGKNEILIPIYNNLLTACKKHPQVDVVINFASFRSAYETSIEALNIPTIKVVVIIAEGIPERLTRQIKAIAKRMGKKIIGPGTVGGFVTGAFKIGNAGGALSNIKMSRLYQSGSVGFVSKSGGMLNEMANVISLNSNGLYEGIAIGGDNFPGSEMIDHLLRYEQNPAIKMTVVLGEVGGKEEYEIVKALQEGRIKKPLIAWVTGTCAKVFPGEVQFGHAGALAREASESADAKNQALQDAGAFVPHSYDTIGELIRKVYQELKAKGAIQERETVIPPEMPIDFNPKTMRVSTTLITTISDDRGEEPLYAGIPISTVIKNQYSIGDIISLLWFKKRLPKFVTEFFELSLILTADHGPCVSGAHNTIVTARAGKDLPAAVSSGILTIGTMFGGSIDGAARYFKSAQDRNLSAKQFLEEMKAIGKKIPGIGHRIKSAQNPDMRVIIIKDWASKNMHEHRLLNFALEVEALTLTKKNNLILNIDGCIGVLFVDIIRETGIYTEAEIDEIIEVGTLNGLFLLARSIGLVGHFLDQKRLNTRLYRHPMDQVLYMLPKEDEVLQDYNREKTEKDGFE